MESFFPEQIGRDSSLGSGLEKNRAQGVCAPVELFSLCSSDAM